MKIKLMIGWVIMVSCGVNAQQTNKEIREIENQLSAKQTSISNVLSDKNYMHLHPVTEFRELIKKYARAEIVTMVTSDEPGKKITVTGNIKTKNGEAMTDALVYVYQTSDKGWYAADMPHVGGNEGDMRHARLFAYFKTNSKGAFEFKTIQPKGYPNSDLPAHIHIAVWKNNQYVPGVPGELLFDDDERLTPERRRRSQQEGYLIEKNSGTITDPVYHYTITINN